MDTQAVHDAVPVPRFGGRKPGSPNHITAQLKRDVMLAYAKVGGVDYLMRVAEEDPRTFCAILMRILPTELKAEVSADLAKAIADARTRLAGPQQ